MPDDVPEAAQLYHPTLVAHRGLHADAPENSVEAFSAAYRAGLEWVECDVWPSADEQIIVIHDETLDRTTTGRGPVRRHHYYGELFNVKLLQPDGSPLANSSPPTLDKLTEINRRHGGKPGLLVEIKPPDLRWFVRNVVGALRGGVPAPFDGRPPQWMIQSFDESNLRHAMAAGAEVGLEVPVALLVERRAELETAAAAGWKDIHLLHDLLDAATAHRLRAHGVRVGVWTPNRLEDLRRVVALRADVIITDEPLLARRVLEELAELKERGQSGPSRLPT